MNRIKTHGVTLLLVGIILFTFIKVVLSFYSGYSGIPYDTFVFLCTEPIRYTLIVICVLAIAVSALSRNLKIRAFVTVATLLIIGLPPTGHFMTLGALLSIHFADPEQVRNDTRVLLDEYQPETYFSDEKNQRFFFSEPIPRNRLPTSLHNGNINDVLVLDDYAFLEKFGIRGLFRGFVVFREGSDIWKDEKAVTLLDGCSYCWRIRIIDGLYWYHAVPTEEEVATVAFPLK